MRSARDNDVTTEDPPPFGGTWKRLYTIVAVELAVIIVALYVFTQVLS